MLLPFPTTYLCEAGLFSYTSASTKTTYPNRLTAETDMRIQLSSNKPDTKEIYKKCKAMPLFLLIFSLFIPTDTSNAFVLKVHSLSTPWPHEWTARHLSCFWTVFSCIPTSAPSLTPFHDSIGLFWTLVWYGKAWFLPWFCQCSSPGLSSQPWERVGWRSGIENVWSSGDLLEKMRKPIFQPQWHVL